ncbi:hypothetical protein NPIL_165281 [Nephila pilipes]|uniref:Serine/threonine-protein phosphatase 4 regulatory subunit 1 n=1 Tax=Nephila pilipes TaxID=299642 RepID=A0A8X6UDQ1_NEPPI|nr:hypothetical protein NPIL_165281 [Nephila pilipes]
MADVFSTEDYEDCGNESSENESSSADIDLDDLAETHILFNCDNEDLIDPDIEDSDMAHKPGVKEPEIFVAEDLLVNPDDLLPPVVKLEKYANSDIVFNRQVVVRNLLETLRMVHENKDDVANVINVLCSISEDYDPTVRTELMVHLPHIAAFCKEVNLNYVIEKYMVPMLITYLGDENNAVRKAAHSAMLTVIEQGLLDKEAVVEKVCPLVLHLTDSIHPEDLRTESIVLMSKLVCQMGKKAIEDLFLEPLFHLLDEQSNNIRKACASTFGDICTAVGREATEEIFLPKFYLLCKDQAWCVRKACTENFMPLSFCVSKEIRRKELSSLYMTLLSDSSRWVRLTAYQALGAFISTFAEPDRTGLYYGKDGILTIVDVPNALVLSSSHEEPNTTSSTNEVLCNGKIEDSSNLSSDDSSSSLDRTNSSTSCDSVVPECNNGTNSSASDVPGDLCHVGNNQTVIEASSSTMTTPGGDRSLAADDITNDSSDGSSNCDPMQLTINNLNSGDNWTSFDSSDNKIVQNGECRNLSEEAVTIQKYLKMGNMENDFDDDNLTEEEKEFKKLWLEAMHSCDEAINGVLSYREMNGTIAMPIDLDQDLVQRMKPDDKSALLNSIVESQELNISSSAAFSGSANNEAIPLISFYNSIRENSKISSTENSDNNEALSNCVQHSTGDLGDTGVDSISNSMRNLSINAQELNNTPNENSLDNDLKESLELKVNNESAFNYFQYWREPLPEIDINTVANCLNDSPGEQLFNNYFVYDANTRRLIEESKGTWWWYEADYASKQKSFLSDGSMLREMRLSDNEAYENKGEPPPAELSPHDQDIVPPELLSLYLKMTDGSNSATDTEIARHCAYSLPAVALTLGRQFWPCLKHTFDVLMSDLPSFVMMWKVRRTLAFSMHQLAVILGPEITSRDLLPVFSRLISDLDEVRIGILQNLCEFLKVIQPEERKQFLPSLPKFLVSVNDHDSNIRNWRFRLILAEQLVLIASLYEPQEVRDHLVPLSFTLIRDKICEVRLAAVRVVAATMKRLSDHPTPIYTKAVLSELTEKFVHSLKWLHRQLYVYICQQMVLEKALSPDQFAEDALPQLLYLCWDRVPNVRIAIARCLVVVIWPMDVFSNPKSPHRELLLQTIHTLQSDMDADVRYYANMVSTHECSCLQNGEFTNVVEPFV